jgi:hypothetical protein
MLDNAGVGVAQFRPSRFIFLFVCSAQRHHLFLGSYRHPLPSVTVLRSTFLRMSAVAANNPAAVAAAAAGAPAAAAAVAPRRPRRVVTFVTGNANKLLETQQCFGDSITLKAQALDCQ